ncbi:hypothetical protein MPRF_50220 [Mycolicibacterium parafortuitum]|uniref:Uncharacterized protein n=1 Tax=Mycolicibacterium parafortuitum TaxID=39692 RepID=A0A7I7UB71_MYCPF|nr:hypothetical protein MPRF_50220 [Mycolicibacterium parafortuitum]
MVNSRAGRRIAGILQVVWAREERGVMKVACRNLSPNPGTRSTPPGQTRVAPEYPARCSRTPPVPRPDPPISGISTPSGTIGQLSVHGWGGMPRYQAHDKPKTPE